jgi:hypothetical protein
LQKWCKKAGKKYKKTAKIAVFLKDCEKID